MFLGVMVALTTACGGTVTAAGGDVTGVATADASVPFGYSPPATVTLAATVLGTGSFNSGVTWSLEPGTAGCGNLGATVSQTGVFTAPTSPQTAVGATCKVVASAVADPTKTGLSTVTITAPPPVVPAFLGAEGGGALSKGGRGGKVYAVTNLNDSGPGSLRACVEASGARTCVFAVAGTINLLKGFLVTSPYLYVAGQTAPGDGIALDLATHTGSATTNPNAIFKILATHDVTIRYLRLWGDYVVDCAQSNTGTLAINTYASYNVIVDHCTMLWHSWEPVGLVGSTAYSAINGRITIQNTLLGESVLSPLSANPPPDSSPQAVGIQSIDINYNGALFQDVDFHHNIITTTSHRNPAVNGSGRIVNNVVANYSRATYVDSYAGMSRYDIVGNYWKPGSASLWPYMMEVMLGRNQASVYVSGNKSDVTGPPGPPAGRGAVTGAESDASQWTLLVGYTPVYQGDYTQTNSAVTPSTGQQPAPTAWQRTSPLPTSGVAITADPVSGLLGSLVADGGVGMSRRLDCAGNWVNVSDSARDRILAYIVAGTGPATRLSSAAAYQGTLPSLGAGIPCPDADGDGIPDAYEQVACGTATCMDAQAVQGDGFTNLEHYLNGK